MKKLLTVLSVFLFSFYNLQAQNPLVGVDHSIFTDSESLTDIWGFGVPTTYPAEHRTFRVYAYLDDANSVLQSVIGVPGGLESYIGTDLPNGYIWNYPAPLGQSTGDAIPQDFLLFFGDNGTAMYDSYVTVGAESDDAINGVTGMQPNISNITFGVGSSNIPTNVYWGSYPYSSEETPDFVMTNEAWLVGDVSGINCFGVGPDFQVLIAQITTTAPDIHYGLNITAFTDQPLNGGENWITYWDPSGLGGTTFSEADGSEMGLLYPTCDEPGCLDELACNYNPDAECYAYCTFPGCTDVNACNYSPIAGCDDGTCSFLTGCTDVGAINYNENAICEDGSCDYEGCMDLNAINFHPGATIDDGTCYYGISGTVFLDTNGNGFQTFGEPGMENWQVDIPSLGLCAYSSDGGHFEFANLPDGTYEVIIESNENWTNTSPVSVMVIVVDGSTSILSFGLEPANDDYSFFNAQECCIFAPNIHCDNGLWPGVFFHNEGTAYLNGVISMEWDPILDAEPQFGSVVPDVLEPGYCEWNLIEYAPGQDDIFRIHILGPGFEYMGQFFPFNISFDFYDFNGEDLFESSITIEPMVVCAYDPNDKYATPTGYEEPKFVLEENTIQYKIRFQNTGNYFAEDVVVLDTLSPLLDYSTFEPQFASHNMNTSFDMNTGEVTFDFSGIYLPDSTNNEPESHGYVVFDIKPIEGLDPGTVLENTAHIYFDSNPAVVTNTEFHTIYECTEISLFDPMPETICLGETVSFENIQDYVEEYSWQFNGGEIETENSTEIDFVGLGNIQLSLTASNPLCESTTDLMIEIVNHPDAIVEDAVICEGETITISAEGGENYEWSTEESTQEIEVSPEETTTYSVEVIDENNCSDNAELTVEVNPSPDIDVTEGVEICPGETADLSATGGEEYLWSTEETTSEITVTPEETTTYTVEAFNSFDCSNEASVTVVVVPLPEATFSALGALLTATEASAYQWYFNGELIPDATQQTYTAQETGNYSIELWNEADCSVISEEITVTIVGIQEWDTYEIKCYPNPVTNRSILELGTIGNCTVQLYNSQGSLIRDYGLINQSNLTIEKAELSAGVYFFWIQRGQELFQLPIEIR